MVSIIFIFLLFCSEKTAERAALSQRVYLTMQEQEKRKRDNDMRRLSSVFNYKKRAA